MLCESCGEREASIYVTQVVDGNVTKLHLCEACAEQSGLDVNSGQGPVNLSEILLGLNDQPDAAEGKPGKKCPACGMSRHDFKNTSRLGCPKCYDVFGSELDSLLEAMHRGKQHVGKIPAKEAAKQAKTTRLAALRKELLSAVASERYEEAARLRDSIRRAQEEPDKRSARETGERDG
ncbi:MAG: UvrB/UvrC motif-containing protein [Kiritimatiellae bacterium]|nr:UvrB/UvrC motif-containing protein [Kiritimatiellia bacterium]